MTTYKLIYYHKTSNLLTGYSNAINISELILLVYHKIQFMRIFISNKNIFFTGLFIIGNMENLSRDTYIWTQIKNVLEEQRAIGSHLPLSIKTKTGTWEFQV